MHRLIASGCLALVALSAIPAEAADTEVDLELVLAVDVSRSMDIGEQQLQRDGYVAAFRHPEVIQAIQSGALGRIAVTYFEWAGPEFHVEIAPWTVIANAADANAFADKLMGGPISRQTGTSISSGLDYALHRFDGNGFASYRQTIDVSGDGANNAGGPVEAARDNVVRHGITINGLPIMVRPSFLSGYFGVANLDRYYEDCVIGGPGAFMISVTDMGNFETAVRRKLVTEIAGLPARVIPAAEVTQDRPKVDCLVGEKTRPGFLDFR
jgi:hypothetical protein